MKKIALEGAMSTGKTTIGTLLSEKLGYPLIDEAARKALEVGFKLDKTATFESQFWMLAHQFEEEMVYAHHNKPFIADRGILSIAVYSYLNKNIKPHQKMFLYRFIREEIILKQRYDKIIYFPPNIKLEDDGVREIDPAFQKKLHMTYMTIAKNWQIPLHVVQSISIEDRVEELYNLITTKDEV